MAQVVSTHTTTPSETTQQRRPLGLLASMALVVGNMIGSGIFLLPAALASFGGISIVGWLFTAAGAMFLALLFARLAAMVPKVGGPYAYTRLGFGDFAGFWIAWGYWISVWTGNAAIAVALVGYLQGVFPILGTYHWLSALVAVGLIWLVTWINVMGIKQAGVFQVITTIMKLMPLVAMATLGLFWINWSHFTPFNVGGQSPLAAITRARCRWPPPVTASSPNCLVGCRRRAFRHWASPSPACWSPSCWSSTIPTPAAWCRSSASSSCWPR